MPGSYEGAGITFSEHWLPRRCAFRSSGRSLSRAPGRKSCVVCHALLQYGERNYLHVRPAGEPRTNFDAPNFAFRLCGV